MIKNIKISLTMTILSLIIVFSGCKANVKTAPWSENEIYEIETIPIVIIEF